ncbi:helix-turn-helix domain-containing protein [Glaciimonas immobilis]|uniref:CRP/FNR family transcriptional regulator n=1 Tax=Glaciimonas immobilis TaxID=728004 RepID=A0A840RZH8_9BURK|nr:helix-turn-helix domain-containing protein [Glaciimonas immobilis]KAF3995920.1 helix-turn-helix domain-containing protein [Glaciimonas immobilis]MBB5202632.1 CRP/FNR family transcriptional regulator [Glaciimonas immobilis]
MGNTTPFTSPLPAFVAKVSSHCGTCNLRDLCLPIGLTDAELDKLDQIVKHRKRIPRDGALYRMNDPFVNLYAIRVGHFKTFQVNANGAHHISGFQMTGQLLGMEAISAYRHQCNAVALEDSEVCEVPFTDLERLLKDVPVMLHQFHRMMSHEIAQDRHAMLQLGNLRAEQRFAAFLLNLSVRYKNRGYSATNFQLRMSREEIANFLGLTNETISRLLSQFKKIGWIKVNNREIELLNLLTLQTLVEGK